MMPRFETKLLPVSPDVTAPDGSDVRILLALAGGSMAHFTLGAGNVSKAVKHKTVEEIWYVLSGSGEMWRADDQGEAVTVLKAGLCLTIPCGTRFQFRSLGPGDLQAAAITMPPWPGEGEAEFVDGKW